MDPVQSGFAEQFFPAAALLRYTYAREQKLDLGRRSGKSRGFGGGGGSKSVRGVPGCFGWPQPAPSLELGTLPILVVVRVQQDAGTTMPVYFSCVPCGFRYLAPCSRLLGA